MHRLSIIVFSISLFLSGCGSVQLNSGPDSTSPAPVDPIPMSTPSPGSANSPTPIPLLVGYGVNGSWFDLYFTDPTNPDGKQITGGPDGPLVSAIDSARLSVDAAIYSLSLDSVRYALVHAFRRGVQVRVVMESDNMDGKDPQYLLEAGLPMLGDRSQGLMHDKFMVIDRTDVWTGSMNFTNDGAYNDNNNLIHIRSRKVADDYEAEFDQMFVDDKFGPHKVSVSPNPRAMIDGVPLDIYFSPEDHVQAALVELLDNAQTSISFLAYSFTADPLGEAIRQRAEAGVKVSGVMETDQVASNSGTEYDAFRAAGLDVRLDANQGLMHQKVMIIDGQIVVTGSYNFSASAETTNDENVLVIYDPVIAQQYLQEFQRVYAIAHP